jgi:hypothetical protein
MKSLLRASLIAAAFGVTFFTFTVAYAGSDQAMGGGLRELAHEWSKSDPGLPDHLNLHIKNAAGDPLVHVKLEDGTTIDDVLPALQALGFQLTAASKLDSSRFEGYLPLSKARAAAELPGVRAISAVQRPQHNAGSVQSQAVALEKADIAQARGFTGAGTRIGVLSDSYNTCGTCTTHAANDIATGDLPSGGVTVLQDSANGTDEGRAMLQLVHDIAPDAQLGFATAEGGQINFSNNILNLRQTFNADVIVDDVFYFAEPMYSDGIIAQAVDTVSGLGAAYFSSAGNNGLEAFEATYNPISYDAAKQLVVTNGGNVQLDQIPAAIRPQTVHLFNRVGAVGFSDPPGITQRYTSAANNNISFQWDEPFLLGKVQTDFNIYVFDANGNWINGATNPTVFYTTDNNVMTDQPFEFLFLPPSPGASTTDYQIVIGNVNGGPARHIKYVTLNGLGVSERQAAPSTWGHSAAQGGQSVAATYYAVPTFPEDFSAPGPVTIYLDQQGNRLATPQIRPVPQITAADGVDTTFFGFDSDRNGLPNFFGTSAAAPDAAAVAALALQAAGGPGHIQPQSMYQLLQSTASPIPVPNDRTIGFAGLGPITFSGMGDWTGWKDFFGLAANGAGYSVHSVAFDVTAAGLIWGSNPNSFVIGASNGLVRADITVSVSADAKTLTLTFAPGTFPAGRSFRFSQPMGNAIELFTQIDPDRMRGTTIIATLESGAVITGQVSAAPLVAVNRFTGAGLINADAATRAAAAAPATVAAQ